MIAAEATRRRRAFLAMALRRVQPGTGSGHAFLRQRTWSQPMADLRAITTQFVIVGGVATSLYMPERATLDLDLLVRAADAAAMHAELIELGCSHEGSLAFGGSRWIDPSGNSIDVLVSSEGWVERAIGFPRRSPTGLPVIDLPYLVLMKLTASRPQDLADLSRMLAQADHATRQRVRATVAEYRGAEDLEDLESLTVLGELEFASE